MNLWGYCDTCRPIFRPEVDRGNETLRYDSRWDRLRDKVLNQYPLCRECEAAGFLTAATEVDHITPWRTGQTEEIKYDLFYGEWNLQPLCKSCHSKKTFKESMSKGRHRRNA